jgi:2-oxoglutarate ferredoxin oxidoreductase subunit beta
LLEHGKPMIFGAQRDKGIRLVGTTPQVFRIGEDGLSEADAWVHDAHDPDPTRAFLLGGMDLPDFPVPMGVLRSVERPTYDALVVEQVAEAKAARKADLQKLLNGRTNWVVA